MFGVENWVRKTIFLSTISVNYFPYTPTLASICHAAIFVNLLFPFGKSVNNRYIGRSTWSSSTLTFHTDICIFDSFAVDSNGQTFFSRLRAGRFMHTSDIWIGMSHSSSSWLTGSYRGGPWNNTVIFHHNIVIFIKIIHCEIVYYVTYRLLALWTSLSRDRFFVSKLEKA